MLAKRLPGGRQGPQAPFRDPSRPGELTSPTGEGHPSTFIRCLEEWKLGGQGDGGSYMTSEWQTQKGASTESSHRVASLLFLFLLSGHPKFKVKRQF